MNKQLHFLYDHKTDVLSISAGHPIYTDSVPLDQNVILHVEPSTQEIVGFSIIDFSKRFSNSETPVGIPIAATFERAGKSKSRAAKRTLRRKRPVS